MMIDVLKSITQFLLEVTHVEITLFFVSWQRSRKLFIDRFAAVQFVEPSYKALYIYLFGPRIVGNMTYKVFLF